MYLAEELIRNDSNEIKFDIYEPEKATIVLGRSRSKEGDVFLENCIKDNIEIIKRVSGGGTVLLSPGMLIWTLLIPTKTFCINQGKWFKLLSGWILDILSGLDIKNPEVKGVSDITIDNKKICGTALYIGANKVLYHGTLLLDIDPIIMEKYLKIPDRVPGYRQNRKHTDFITTLKIQGCNHNKEEIIKAFRESAKPSEDDYLKM